MTKEIDAEYNKLKTKYNLPSYEVIDNEFEISSFENEKFLIKNALRKIDERLEFYINLIGPIIHPDASLLSNIHEIKFFNEDEKEEVYELFKKLMKYDRNLIETVLDANEEKCASLLNSFMADWPEIKKKLLKYISQMKNTWDKESSIEEDNGYLG